MVTAANSCDHDAHYLYSQKEFAQCRAHYETPLMDARHCVIAADVICHARLGEATEAKEPKLFNAI